MAASEGCLTLGISGSVAEAVRCETDSITRRLDEFEDRSRRENLIFYGLPDSQTESWVESENKIRDVLFILGTPLSEGAIERAHRLGKFDHNKTRPIITKFSSFKIKDLVFSSRSTLKPSKVNITEDFCVATRKLRKKLTEFGSASGLPFSIRYNKVYINKKCYMYVQSSDSVCEIDVHKDDAHVHDATTAERTATHRASQS
ncbi:hypothetical protein HPB48_018048 [Haemaphysalis longicornis]|uniref:Uncharacterized protein n=1 Tax=Haemaphysalis longicornis TaxID=44386 RepID=A0A9J6GKE6_HAELO|nr:hypothetical protein HPB48_018048 [Haemaphysalis longicornis]